MNPPSGQLGQKSHKIYRRLQQTERTRMDRRTLGDLPYTDKFHIMNRLNVQELQRSHIFDNPLQNWEMLSKLVKLLITVLPFLNNTHKNKYISFNVVLL